MSINLHGQSFLTLKDFDRETIENLIDSARILKLEKAKGKEQRRLVGKNIALIFEKDSTRTRIGFEVAAYDQGAHVTYLGPSGSQLGRKESIKDTARVLGQIYDGIEYRGFSQKNVETLAEFSGVPVFNGLTNEYHPTQILADLLTMSEHVRKPLRELCVCFLGDTSNNVASSLAIGAAKMGLEIRLCGPDLCHPKRELLDFVTSEVKRTDGKFRYSSDVNEAVKGCDVLYTDVWVSMGEPESQWMSRIHALRDYQVNAATMQGTGNVNVKFMHCLPALHNRDTALGAILYEKYGLESLEVTDDVFESSASIVFDQAENRMHTIKALLVETMAGK